MNNFLVYLVECNAGLVLFLILYRLLLQRETNFSFKRAYLLAALLVSAIVPAVGMGLQSPLAPAFEVRLPEVFVTALRGPVRSNGTPLLLSVFAFYAFGVVIQFIRLIARLFSLRSFLKSATVLAKTSFGTIVESREPAPVFSFFRIIHLGHAGALTQTEKDQIIRHEAIHVSQLHSLDLLLVEMLAIACWFNPAIYLYRRHLSSIHEFQADHHTVGNQNPDVYIGLLAKVALLSADFPMVSPFNSMITLKRIQMMKTIKKRMNSWKVIALAPAFLLFGVIACQDQLNSSAIKGDVYTEVDEIPEFKGGLPALMKYIQSNLKYPREARERGLEGKVFVSFVVTSDGKIAQPEIKTSADEMLDKEALRVVANSPDWVPGRNKGQPVNVKLTLPINFKLAGN